MISVELIGIQVDPLSGAAAVVLREQDAPNRLLPIIVGTNDAGSIAIAASGQRLPRPMPHDLMAALVESLDGHLDAVEVTELHDGAFFAELTISGPAGRRRIDTRPSDAIALAVRLSAPLFVSEQVLDEAGALPIDTSEADHVAIEAAIDAEVDQFRAFLEELDPDDFIETSATEADGADESPPSQPEIIEAGRPVEHGPVDLDATTESAVDASAGVGSSADIDREGGIDASAGVGSSADIDREGGIDASAGVDPSSDLDREGGIDEPTADGDSPHHLD